MNKLMEHIQPKSNKPQYDLLQYLNPVSVEMNKCLGEEDNRDVPDCCGACHTELQQGQLLF